MSMEPVDYTAILADLEAKKAALEQTIASFRQAMATGALGQTAGDGAVAPSLAVPSLTGGEVPAGAFHGKSILDATRLYLEIVKKKQTTREIADALRKGGMESTSDNFVGIVTAGLNRTYRTSPNCGLVKLGTQWGLASWYPKGIVAAAKGPAKKAKKKNRKAVNESASKTNGHAAVKGPQRVPEIIISSEGNPAERALKILQVNAGAAFTSQEMALMLRLKPNAAPLILANLVRSHKAEKTADGKYRAATSTVSAAV